MLYKKDLHVNEINHYTTIYARVEVGSGLQLPTLAKLCLLSVVMLELRLKYILQSVRTRIDCVDP